MTPVKVHTPLPAGVSLSDFNALLTAAGLSASLANEWVVDCPKGGGVAVLLVVAVDDPATSAALANAVRETISRGERVIAVWPPAAGSANLAPVLQDYGAGLVIWDPAAVHAAICGQSIEWQDVGGGTRPQRALERNGNC